MNARMRMRWWRSSSAALHRLRIAALSERSNTPASCSLSSLAEEDERRGGTVARVAAAFCAVLRERSCVVPRHGEDQLIRIFGSMGLDDPPRAVVAARRLAAHAGRGGDRPWSRPAASGCRGCVSTSEGEVREEKSRGVNVRRGWRFAGRVRLQRNFTRKCRQRPRIDSTTWAPTTAPTAPTGFFNDA